MSGLQLRAHLPMLPTELFDYDGFVSAHQHVVHAASSALLVAVDDGSAAASSAPPEFGGISYSRASYYTVLGLYLISFPGLWSTISRSTKAKIKAKTYVSPGENAPSADNGKSLRQEAGEIMACTFLPSLLSLPFCCTISIVATPAAILSTPHSRLPSFLSCFGSFCLIFCLCRKLGGTKQT